MGTAVGAMRVNDFFVLADGGDGLGTALGSGPTRPINRGRRDVTSVEVVQIYSNVVLGDGIVLLGRFETPCDRSSERRLASPETFVVAPRELFLGLVVPLFSGEVKEAEAFDLVLRPTASIEIQ